jgi:effector-binding domain-containing protein
VDVTELRGMLKLREAELREQIAADTARLVQVEARLSIIETEGQMPATEIQIKRVPAVRVAQLSARADGFEPNAIGPVIQPLYAELGKRLADAGVAPVGPALAYYDDAGNGTDGAIVVHAALPVNAEPGSGDFDIVDLPEIEQAATVVHHGSMYDVMPTVQMLARWIDSNGYRSTGYHREITLEVTDTCDPAVTELQEPITR